MQLQVEKQRWVVREQLVHIDRPDSTKHVDLHVYVVPKAVWKKSQNLAENDAMARSVSVGFVRASEDLSIGDLRNQILDLCRKEQNFPKEFVYLRSVGRSLTKVKAPQEKQLKVKNYRPPTTFAPEIFILEADDVDDSSATHGDDTHLSRESPINEERWKKSSDGLSTDGSIQSTSHRLQKLSEEQERLSLRQEELARERQDIEDEISKEEAAIKIQKAFRKYRKRQDRKQRDHSVELDLLQSKSGKSAGDKDDLDYDDQRLSRRMQLLRIRQLELRASRDVVLHRMQRLQAQITIRRREEKDLWKQKYLIEKTQIPVIEEQHRTASKGQVDLRGQLEQVIIRLNHATKLRQQGENEARLLRYELQQICSSLNDIERYRLPRAREWIDTDISARS